MGKKKKPSGRKVDLRPNKKKEKVISFRDKGKFELLFDANNNGVMTYHCAGTSYSITEDLCDARQRKGFFKKCKRCPVRMGGPEDPRGTKGE